MHNTSRQPVLDTKLLVLIYLVYKVFYIDKFTSGVVVTAKHSREVKVALAVARMKQCKQISRLR